MWSSHATKRPVAYSGLHARQPHRAVLLHTNGGGSDNGSLYGWWSGIAKNGQHLGAHFQVMTSGHAEQYVDTSEVIYHAYSASEWAVGIETEDDDHPERPWTPAQLATIIAICRDLGVPGRVLTDAPGDGIGWHEQYQDWNKDGHHCPGSVREAQIRNVILPALVGKPAAPVYVYKRTLRLGMVGLDVASLKRRLKYLGYSSVPGPIFGRGLDAAVRSFQTKHRLTVDGVVGPITAKAIG